MYGKIENGELKKAPRKLENVPRTFPPAEEGGEPVTMLCTVTNPTDEQYAAAGYLPIRYTDAPEAPAGYHAEPDYTENNGEIVQVWTFVEDVPEPPSIEDALYKLAGGI